MTAQISTKVEAARATAASAAWAVAEFTKDDIVTILTIVLLASQIFVMLPKISHTINKFRRWVKKMPPEVSDEH